jgi:hypothetical protein
MMERFTMGTATEIKWMLTLSIALNLAFNCPQFFVPAIFLVSGILE